MSDHVRHMGFELELAATKIVAALAYVPEDKREDIISKLAPIRLQRAVRGMMP